MKASFPVEKLISWSYPSSHADKLATKQSKYSRMLNLESSFIPSPDFNFVIPLSSHTWGLAQCLARSRRAMYVWSQATTDLLSVIRVLPFLDFHINKIIQNVVFYIWLSYVSEIHPSCHMHMHEFIFCLAWAFGFGAVLTSVLAALPCSTCVFPESWGFLNRVHFSWVTHYHFQPPGEPALLFTWLMVPLPLTTHCPGEEPEGYRPPSLSLRYITCEFHSR